MIGYTARQMKPLAIDLFCGLGGWTEGLLFEGFDVIGFDIERHAYGDHQYPAQLVLQDVRTIDGAQFKDAALIVASSPCQEFSYRAMPWKRSKALGPPFLGMELFAQAERIQREAIAAAGHFIPMVQENVRGAQKWVGRARWHYGSYYLWGDVPALMPIALKTAKVPGFAGFDGPVGFNVQAVRNMKADDSVKVGGARGDDWFTHHNRDEFADRAAKRTLGGVKQGGSWFNDSKGTLRSHSSNSTARKAASARIAKIPLPLARHIAMVYRNASRES